MPIWAKRPSANAPEMVAKRRSRSRSTRRVARGAASACGSDSAEPAASGFGRRYFAANGHRTAAIARPMSAAADGNPKRAISTTHSGTKTRPPMLAPLKARLSAFGLSRSNQGATMAFIAAPLVAAHPAPLGNAAANSCHGSRAFDQARMPSAAKATPACVTRAMPKRRCASGRHVTSMALNRKWAVIAAETLDIAQPRSA
jgi:hypothetical protein